MTHTFRAKKKAWMYRIICSLRSVRSAGKRKQTCLVRSSLRFFTEVRGPRLLIQKMTVILTLSLKI